MVFSNLEFLFLYFPVTLLFYYAVPFRFRNLILLIFSLIFYGWGEPRYVFLMMFTIAADYAFGLLIAKAKDRKAAKSWMIGAVILNLGLLGFFKYADFLIENVKLIPFLSDLDPLGISLPIGISFYTFQALSYVIDVYRGTCKAQKSAVAFGTYVTLFPQLIAGPIVRYTDVDAQLTVREHSADKFTDGIMTFTAGLCKKVLLANTAGEMWSILSALSVENRTVLGSWMGIIFYTFQIYFDFSGYSDMAIGLGKMFGFNFPQNFNYPYIARSITDFWRRWHISLSTWFREYVYIPLGGNRVGRIKLYRNLLAVWFLTGLWHGASWNFILWGLYYFVILVMEKTFLLKMLEKAGKVLPHIYTMLLVVFGWLLFVSADIGGMGEGFRYLGSMFGAGNTVFTNAVTNFDLVRNLPFIALLIVACTPLPKKIWHHLCEKSSTYRVILYALAMIFLLISIAYMVNSSYNPFLYYRF